MPLVLSWLKPLLLLEQWDLCDAAQQAPQGRAHSCEMPEWRLEAAAIQQVGPGRMSAAQKDLVQVPGLIQELLHQVSQPVFQKVKL